MEKTLTINLEDLFGDKESVIQQIIDVLSEQIDIEIEVKKAIEVKTTQIVEKQLETMLSGICENLIDVPFVEVDRWGEKKGSKTIRQTIINAIQGQCLYDNKSSYSSDRNIFTRTVCDCVEKEVGKFKTLFAKKIDEIFLDECQQYAVSKIQERLKIK